MLSVLIPVYNEVEILKENVQKVHAYLERHSINHELIIANNGSVDGTLELARELASEQEWISVVSTPEKGVGRAFVLGVKAARGDKLAVLDADLSSELLFLNYAFDLLEHAEMVVGSKTLGKQRRTPVRVIGSQLYILFSQIFFDLPLSDFSVGSKAFRVKEILPILDHLDTWTGYTFEICLFLELQGKRVVQVGINCDDRRKSHFNLFHEGYYRYWHLYRSYKLRRNPQSWMNQIKL